ncbi:hypothetical protein [Actinophytocola sp.]|uniref:hypothetical protein n=1 Tax=Actinophytocola sp. TaxID=1872138 RepID=UPI00389AAB52
MGARTLDGPAVAAAVLDRVRVAALDEPGFVPAAIGGITALLDAYDVRPAYRQAVVVGRDGILARGRDAHRADAAAEQTVGAARRRS